MDFESFAFAVPWFDLALLAVIIGGGLWGYFGGGFKTLFKLFFIVAPAVTMAYFGDQIADVSTSIVGMMGDRTSIPLAVVGAMGGVLGMIGVTGAFYIFSQFVLHMLHLHRPGPLDHGIGAVAGIVGVLGICTTLFITTVKAAPVQAQGFVAGSYVWPYARHGVAYAYPPISGFIDRRMSGLLNGLSGNTILARMAAGGQAAFSPETIDLALEAVSKIDFEEILKLQEAANKLDPDTLKQLVTDYKSGELSELRLREQLDNPDIQKLSGEAPAAAAQ